MEERNGINLSNISYDENGEIVFNDIDNNKIEYELNKPLENEDKTIPMTNEEKAANLSQTMEEIEQDMVEQKKRNKQQESVIYMNEKNTMFLSCCLFTILGLSFGTFVFSDYITCTLIGLVMGIIAGIFLCKKIPKQDITESINENETQKGKEE